MNEFPQLMRDRLVVVGKYVKMENTEGHDRLKLLVKSLGINKEMMEQFLKEGNYEGAVYHFSRACVNIGEFHEYYLINVAKKKGEKQSE